MIQPTTTFTEVQKAAALAALQAVVDDARDERVAALRERIAELRTAIDARMKLRERAQQRFEAVTQAASRLESVASPEAAVLRDLFLLHSAYLKRRMAALRPDAELCRKQELEADLIELEAHRDLAVSMQRRMVDEFRK